MNWELFGKNMQTHNLATISDKDLKEMILYGKQTLRHLAKEDRRRREKKVRCDDNNMYFCETCNKKYDYYYRPQHLKSAKHIKLLNKIFLE
jgi:NAD(P)H-nitrite reductase large subunit